MIICLRRMLNTSVVQGTQFNAVITEYCYSYLKIINFTTQYSFKSSLLVEIIIFYSAIDSHHK